MPRLMSGVLTLDARCPFDCLKNIVILKDFKAIRFPDVRTLTNVEIQH